MIKVYAQPPRPSRNRKRGRAGGTNRVAIVLFVLVLMALLYLAVAGFAGKWVAQNVVAPLLDTFSGGSSGSAPSQGPGASAGATASAAEQTQQEVSVPSIRVECVQLGLFSSKENAGQVADGSRKQGGAGFVLEDANQYRVLASGYEKSADAQTVREQLKGQGVEATLYTLSSDPIRLQLTAPKDKAQALSTLFTTYNDVRSACYTLSAQLDKKELTLQQVCEQLEQQKAKLQALLDVLPDSQQDAVMQALRAMLEQSIQSLTDTSGRTQEQDLSCAIKNAHLRLSQLYAEFTKTVNA